MHGGAGTGGTGSQPGNGETAGTGHPGGNADAYAHEGGIAGQSDEEALIRKRLGYGTGDLVRHQKFGEGMVVKIVSGGRDYEVTVQFHQAGVKKMFAAFAKLKKV